jgi:DnaJ-class molecular chaperone
VKIFGDDMTWVPFITRTDPDSCKTCNGFGGIYDDETMNGEGLPHEMACPECHPYENDD